MRGGSKSIPLKSITPVLGRPLCYYTIVEAKKSKLINRLIIYTGDPRIIKIARKYNVEVPVLEKDELQNDLLTFQNCLRSLQEKENYKPDVIVHLRVTSPLRDVADIDGAIKLLINNPKADSVRGVTDPELTPFKMYSFDEKKNQYLQPFLTSRHFPFLSKIRDQYAMPRQFFPRVVRHTGVIDVYRWSNIIKKNTLTGKNILPYYIDRTRTAGVNYPDDIPYVEFLLKRASKTRRR